MKPRQQMLFLKNNGGFMLTLLSAVPRTTWPIPVMAKSFWNVEGNPPQEGAWRAKP